MPIFYEIIIRNILFPDEGNGFCIRKKSPTEITTAEKCECVGKRKRNREMEPDSEEQSGEIENEQQCKKQVCIFTVI